jgi:sulfur-oxidizing protein SoxZ
MAARTLIQAPASVRRGESFSLRVLLQHPMESGYRPGADGRVLPRDIVRRFGCSYNGERVLEVELFPAVAANPYLEFSALAVDSGTLVFEWQGDNGFIHREQRAISVT